MSLTNLMGFNKEDKMAYVTKKNGMIISFHKWKWKARKKLDEIQYLLERDPDITKIFNITRDRDFLETTGHLHDRTLWSIEKIPFE